MKKIKKISSVSNKIIQILFWINTIGCVIATLGVLLVIGIFPIPTAPPTISLDWLEFTLPMDNLPTYPNSSLLIIVLYLWGIYGVATYIMQQLKSIFKQMETGRPFHCQISSAVRRIAFAVLIGGVVYYIGQNIISFVYYKMYAMDTLFLSSNILSCRLKFSFDLGFVFIFILLLLLSYVFEYGEELQVLSDETL